MTSLVVKRSYDLGKIGANGARAIVDALRIDEENVRSADYDPHTNTLHFECAPEAVAHVLALIGQMTRTQKLISRRILEESHASDFKVHDIDGDLAASPDVQTIGDGLIGLRGRLLKLFRFFERTFRQFAAEYGADEQHYPVMVPSEILSEVGYFGHFPQHVTFCSHLRGDLPVLQAVAADAGAGTEALLQRLPGRLTAPRHVLTPAVCLPCYRQQRDVVLEEGQVKTLTMQNHVFRYEGMNFRPLERGWDFTVRDIVFFGGYEDLLRLRLEVMERTMELCRELDLEVSIALANDPFFLDASRDKAVYQRMGEVKYELLFPLPSHATSLAASSFNLHRDYYTAIYGTRLHGGELAESACMGFGLERWVYGFLSQKGLDPADWPRRVTSNLE